MRRDIDIRKMSQPTDNISISSKESYRIGDLQEIFAHTLGFIDWHGYLAACTTLVGRLKIRKTIKKLSLGEEISI